MSQKISKGRTIRELAPAEMDKVGGGLLIRVRGVGQVSQKIPVGYVGKRVTGAVGGVAGKL